MKNISDKELTAVVNKMKHFSAVASLTGDNKENPWTSVDKELSSDIDYDFYVETIKMIRFFYRTEPMVSTVINKLVEIGTGELIISKDRLSDNEHRAFLFIKDKLINFSAIMAQEYLLSGLVVPEIGFSAVDSNVTKAFGLKKYSSLQVPDSMYVRDPSTIVILSSIITDKPSYYVKIPEDMVKFIKDKGVYDGEREDKDLYVALKKMYPEFVKEVESGKEEVLLTNPNIIRRKYLPDNPYPVPFVSSSLDALQHKRQMRRMDYSLMDKIINAILHIKAGSDEFPITEAEEDVEFLATLKSQLAFRDRSNGETDKLFQLITSHIVDISWIFPDSEILLSDAKYSDINQEILFGLGFPQSLITGETKRSGAGDVEMSLVSPIKTMESYRLALTPVLQQICYDMAEKNGMKNAPTVSFAPINLHKFTDFVDALKSLYEVSAVSRTTFAGYLGRDFETEVDLLESEVNLLKSKNLPIFGETPNSRNPNDTGNTQDTQPVEDEPVTEDTVTE